MRLKKLALQALPAALFAFYFEFSNQILRQLVLRAILGARAALRTAWILSGFRLIKPVFDALKTVGVLTGVAFCRLE